MGFDLNGAWGQTVDFTVALSSDSTTDPQVRIKRRVIQIIFCTISETNVLLVRAFQPLLLLSQFQYGP
jgi:hypothetical protein